MYGKKNGSRVRSRALESDDEGSRDNGAFTIRNIFRQRRDEKRTPRCVCVLEGFLDGLLPFLLRDCHADIKDIIKRS